MLFRKRMPKSCEYCAHATKLTEETALCTKKGVISQQGKCRKFSYDPCKRIPPKPKPLDFSKYDKEDYSL